MASTQKIAGKKATTYKVMWRTTGGHQLSRNWKSAAAAARYEAWRTLNPDALDTEFDHPEVVPWAQLPPEGPTVAQMWKRYRAARGTVSRAHTAKQESIFDSQLAPLHRIPVTQLKTLDIKTWMNNLEQPDGTPYSAATKGAALTLLRAILGAAVEDGALIVNPALNVKGPQLEGALLTEGDVLTPGELAAVLAVIPEQWRALFTFLGYTGARLSEALGLTVDQLNMPAGTVHLGTRVAEEVGAIQIRDSGKTPAADRVISMPAPLLAELKRHLEAYNPQPGEPLFGNASRAIPSRSVLRQRVWDPAREAAGIKRPIPMRNLRHSHATHCLTVMKPLAVAVRLGHARPTITLNTYARFIADPKAAELDNAALDAYLGASAELAAALS